MQNYLNEIVLRKRKEVDLLLTQKNLHLTQQMKEMMPINSNHRFSTALKQKDLSIIAEIKRKSPSKGEIGTIQHPEKLAIKYCEGGASAISVLTDFVGFGGTIDDLQNVSDTLKQYYPSVVTLRKDFIVHPIQLAEAVTAGASAVLLISHVLQNELASYINTAAQLGLESLVEVHDYDDLLLALDAGATIIGVNHRNLNTFTMDFQMTEKLKPFIPKNIITVAESGMHTAEDAKKMRGLGYDAILVGEALVSSASPENLITQMKKASYAS